VPGTSTDETTTSDGATGGSTGSGTTTGATTTGDTATSGGGTDAEGTIAYVRWESEQREIYAQVIGGGPPVNLTQHDGFEESPDWTPDGAQILFWSGWSGNHDVWVMDADGSNPLQLTTKPEPDRYPHASPDGTRVAFQVTAGTVALHVIGIDGSNEVDVSGELLAEGRAWAPDGQQIAFSAEGDIYVVDVDGTNRVQITQDPARDAGVTWSPDGSTIAFDSDRDGTTRLWTMDADGSNPTPLSAGPDDSYAEWSPDGTHVAFIRDEANVGVLMVISAAGGQETVVSANDDDVARFTWSPDGAYLAYDSGRTERMLVYIAGIDGSGTVRLTDDEIADHESRPAWRP
jgi:TolB protein